MKSQSCLRLIARRCPPLCCRLFAVLFAATPLLVNAASPPVSKSVAYTESGKLYSTLDHRGNRVPDFSLVGYKGGLVPIPSVPVAVTISPVAGDDGANIQAAINQVAALPLDANGFRGAVLLTAGEYDIAGTVSVTASGIVLRGQGDDPTSGTRLRASGTTQRTLVRIDGSGSRTTIAGTTHNLVANYTPVGARTFLVDSTSGLAVGDEVIVRRPSPANWIHDIYMDLLTNPWTAGSKDLSFDRIITRIEGNWITVDSPLGNSFEAIYNGGTIFKYTWSGRIENCGIEDIYSLSDFVSSTDEAHGWTFIEIREAKNCWVRNITSQYYGYSAVSALGNSKFVTVQDCQCLDPVSQITGGRRYSFLIDDASSVLYTNCYARQGRHDFVLGSTVPGLNAFVDGKADQAKSDTGPHHRWSAGTLFDNISVSGHNIDAENRGNSGSGHGWAGANKVFWNCKANNFRVQNPWTAQNWLIGAIGNILSGQTSGAVGPVQDGIYDTLGINVRPRSLYAAQFSERTSVPDLAYREYWIGDIDGFIPAGGSGDIVYIDPAWQTEVDNATTAPLVGFDSVAQNQAVPFTFAFNLASGEKVVGATLTLMLRASAGNVSDDSLYLESMAAGFSLADLGWLPLTASNAVGAEIDPGMLLDGQLNVAILNDAGVDWALLDIRVAPAGSETLPPAAPGALAAYAGNGEVYLTWAASLLADSYNVKRATVSGGPYTTIAAGVITTEYTDTNVVNGTTYYYVVSGVNGNGESANSTQVSATPASSGVPAPWLTQDIGAVAAAGSAAYNAGTFTVQGSGADIWGTADEFRYVYQAASGDTEVIARVATLQNVNAWTKGGVMIRETLSANSAFVGVYVTPANGVSMQYRGSAGASATDFSRATGIVAPHWVRLVRSDNVFTGYRSADGVNWTSMGSLTINMGINVNVGMALTSHSDGTLATASFDNVTVASPTPPPAPTGLTATAGNNQVTLSWTASSGATSYNVKRATVTGGPYADIATGVTSTSYTDTTAVNGTTYFYVVSAVNSTGESDTSDEVSATPSCSVPAVPGGLTATAGDAQVLLNWTASSGATSYNVKRSTTSGGPYTTIATGVTATSYNDTTAVNGTTYYYVVSAVNSCGESGDSVEVNATPQAPALPAAPTNLSASAGKKKVTLNWTQSTSPNITQNKIYRSTTSGGPYTLIATLNATTSYNNTGLTSGTTYYYVVTAVNSSSQESPFSNQASATAR